MMERMNNKDYYDSLALYNILKELNTYSLAQLRTILFNMNREIAKDKVERTQPYTDLRNEVLCEVKGAIYEIVINGEGEEV